MSLRMHLGRRGSLLTDRPGGLRLVRNEHPVLLAAEMAALRAGAGAQVVTLDATWSAAGERPPTPCATALDGLCRSAGRAVQEGARIVILSDRAADRERAPLPMLLAVGPYTSTCSKAACGRDSVSSPKPGTPGTCTTSLR